MNLTNFIKESNRIEDINRDPTEQEIYEHEKFLDLEKVTIGNLVFFTKHICGVGHSQEWLRTERGMNRRVGKHIAPPGGIEISKKLTDLLGRINRGSVTPYKAHCEYEMLHPFMDGNGRSGRVLWLWHMHQEHGVDNLGPVYARGFLHTFYYQSLDNYN